jgi:general secretion pathway protein L
MTSIVIADRSFLSETIRSVQSALPAALQRLIRGPISTIAIAEAPADNRRRSGQPVDVIVSSDIVLRRRIVVPAKARKEVAHAIGLFIQTETPFAPNEVLVHALEDVARPSDLQLAYTVRLLPRTVLLQGLTAHRLRTGRVGRILLDGMPDVDFAPALFPSRRLLRWLPAIPVALTLTALALLGLSDLSQRQLQITELESEIALTLGRVRVLTADIDAARQQQSGTGVVLKLLNETPSAFLTLESIRKFLPDGAEVLRIDLRGAETRLAIRSPNALADAQRLAGPETRWSSSIEGPITADPTSSLEMATILLRPRRVGAE